jgi:hypothetical protein
MQRNLSGSNLNYNPVGWLAEVWELTKALHDINLNEEKEILKA